MSGTRGRLFFVCDVFTERRFGGNPLAVVPDAEGLSDARMQQVAREFNLSETAFVLPAADDGDRRVRIFTPATEVPFAGHPNVGTAFVLARTGLLGDQRPPFTLTFEEEAGPVAVSVTEAPDGRIRCELSAPQPLALGGTASVGRVAAAVGVEPGDVVVETHAPRAASVGLPFLFVELGSMEALRRARPRSEGLSALARDGLPSEVHLYVRTEDDFDIRARMFAPLAGVPEDPATGSANVALAGLLAEHRPEPEGSFAWRIAQGVEMGRPSVLEARAEKLGGSVVETRIGGFSALVSEGRMQMD